ncbi:penicillin-binding protein 1C [Testudinibacter sp. P27/CKL/0425]
MTSWIRQALTPRAKPLLFSALLLVLLLICLPRILDRLFPLVTSRYQQHSLLITDRHGEWLRGYLSADQSWRMPLTNNQLPNDYLILLINYEDRRFYQHHGIDYRAIMRAAGQNLRQGQIVSGASTLTMQTARLLMPHSGGWRGKITEAFRAWQLERQFSKAEILQIYMQLAPMGGNLEGIASAAHYYFNKPADKLSLAEAAWLVSLPQSPHFYHPLRYPERATAARNRVLSRALDSALISQEQYQRAVAQAITIQPTAFPLIAPHFTDQAKAKAADQAIITTSLDKGLQLKLEQLLKRSLPQRHQNSNLAAAILDNRSGDYLAYVASADFFSTARHGQVDMLQAVRSPGSALKPFITLFAFDWLNYQPTTLIQDTPIVDDAYQPNNYDGGYQGEISLASALVRSRNVPAVRLLRAINPFRFSQHLQRHGLPLYLPKNAQPNLSLALGGVGVKGAELLQLYRTLANCSYAQAPFGALATPSACWQVTEILQQTQDQNGRLFWGKEPVALKTGTSYGWRDQWLFAYTRDYSIVLWGGRADGKFATQRASAEDLIPLLRGVLGLLDNPPRQYAPPHYPLTIRSGKLPPRLQRVELPRNESTAASAQQIATQAPLSGSTLELAQIRDLNLQISGGNPPYLWFLNDHLIYQGNDQRYLLQHANPGSYRLVVIDADGNSAQSDFRLQRNAAQNPGQSAPATNRVKIIRSDSEQSAQAADKN